MNLVLGKWLPYERRLAITMGLFGYNPGPDCELSRIDPKLMKFVFRYVDGLEFKDGDTGEVESAKDSYYHPERNKRSSRSIQDSSLSLRKTSRG